MLRNSPWPNLCLHTRLLFLLLLVLQWACVSGSRRPPLQNAAVLTEHNDNARTGANLRETTLHVSNVGAGRFGKLFSRSADGQIYAQPLYVSGLEIAGKGKHNVIFLATMANTVYAYDADSPAASAPLWSVNLGPAVPWTDIVLCAARGRSDINGPIGITSTPVIDVERRTLYCVAKTKESGVYHQRLHALDITSGGERPGSPVEIRASTRGSGYDANKAGIIRFDPLMQLNRPALLLANSRIYIAFGSHCDADPYHGWLLEYDAATLRQTAVFNTTPNGKRGSIWQSGQGAAADESGSVYFITADGSFDADRGGPDLAMSFVKLSAAGASLASRGPLPAGNLSLADWFTPHDEKHLNADDIDLGSGGPMLIPGGSLLVGGGKQGCLYLLNRNHMGKFRRDNDNQIQQVIHKAANGPIHGSPVYWDGPAGPAIYVWGCYDQLKAWKLVQQRSLVLREHSLLPAPSGVPGGILSISADGSRAGTGIVWASLPFEGHATHQSVWGILRAFDASDLHKELWNSKMNPQRDDLGYFAKFCPPTIANGKVYMATFSNTLVVYGLLDER
jgi:hypothetical protein